jgi:hypothetical protein
MYSSPDIIKMIEDEVDRAYSMHDICKMHTKLLSEYLKRGDYLGG